MIESKPIVCLVAVASGLVVLGPALRGAETEAAETPEASETSETSETSKTPETLETTEFDTHLLSPVMVSPAQIHHYDALAFDSLVDYRQRNESFEPIVPGEEVKTTTATTAVSASGVYRLPAPDMRAGITARYAKNRLDGTQEDAEQGIDGKSVTLSPVASYKLYGVVFAAAVDVVQVERKPTAPSNAKRRKRTYTRLQPAALWTNGTSEVGLAYRSANRMAAQKDGKAAVTEPARVTVHGRHAVNAALAIGGMIQNRHWRSFDAERFRDRQLVRTTAEYRYKQIDAEASLTLESASHESEKVMTTKTLSTFEVSSAADYTVSENFKCGGGFSYGFGVNENSETKYDAYFGSVSLRSALRF